MVTARSAAMAFNRIVDRRYDAANPRTADRPLPRGALSTAAAAAFTLVMVAGFALSAAMLNLACLYLTPVALVVVLGYSYAKRFTALSHVWLGLSLSIAPAGAWIGVRGALDEPYPFLLAAAVVFWTAGFDIIYACLDVAFDRSTGLRSIPARIGVKPALRVSAALHALFAATLVVLGVVEGSGWPWWAGTGVVAALLVYEHAIVKSDDLKRVNVAFFRVNAVVSAIVMGAGLSALSPNTSLFQAVALPLDVSFEEKQYRRAENISGYSLWTELDKLDWDSVEGHRCRFIFSPDGRRVAYDVENSLVSENSRYQPNGVFSPNGRRFVRSVNCIELGELKWEWGKGPLGLPWFVRSGCVEGMSVIVDGVCSEPYESIANVTFSPDSRRVAYVGITKARSDYVVVLDGAPFVRGCSSRLVFSRDGRRFAFREIVQEKERWVVDGRPDVSYEHVSDLVFSPDGNRYAYIASRENGCVVLNGVVAYDQASILMPPHFIRDGASLLYMAAERKAIVIDGVKKQEFVEVERWGMSPDGNHMAFSVWDGARSRVVMDGVRVDAIDVQGNYSIRSIRVAPDGKWVAYLCGFNRVFAVVNGQRSESFHSIEGLTISPDGRHVAYVVTNEAGSERVALDGTPGETTDWIASDTLIFSPDSRKLAYGARKGRELWWKVIDVK
jgi:4-hydroxybenzoate polyprenyltransferase